MQNRINLRKDLKGCRKINNDIEIGIGTKINKKFGKNLKPKTFELKATVMAKREEQMRGILEKFKYVKREKVMVNLQTIKTVIKKEEERY